MSQVGMHMGMHPIKHLRWNAIACKSKHKHGSGATGIVSWSLAVQTGAEAVEMGCSRLQLIPGKLISGVAAFKKVV